MRRGRTPGPPHCLCGRPASRPATGGPAARIIPQENVGANLTLAEVGVPVRRRCPRVARFVGMQQVDSSRQSLEPARRRSERSSPQRARGRCQAEADLDSRLRLGHRPPDLRECVESSEPTAFSPPACSRSERGHSRRASRRPRPAADPLSLRPGVSAWTITAAPPDLSAASQVCCRICASHSGRCCWRQR